MLNIRPITIYCIFPPEVHLLDITGPIHVFYEAQEYGAELQTAFLSMEGKTTASSSAGLDFYQLQPYQQAQPIAGDYIFLPGLSSALISDRRFIKEQQPFFNWLQLQLSRGVQICSVCTGAFLLAEAGLLDGRNCTTHWKFLDDFRQRFPKAQLAERRLFVTDGPIQTSAGVSSGIDLALHLLETHYGGQFAADVAKEIVIYFRRSEGDPQLSVFLQYRNHIDTRIHEVQSYISRSLHESCRIEELADLVHMSSRNLTRHFKSATGLTIGAFTAELRREQARQLLKQGHKQDYVAQACGLKSSKQLRLLLKK